MRVLLTGFEAFDNDTLNPSQQIVTHFTAAPPPGLDLRGAVLPVDTEAAPSVLHALLDAHQPEAVLLTGVAVQRPALCLERVALNLLDFRIPDNAGRQVQDQPIVPSGPDAYFATLPVRALVERLIAAGIPATLSETAGTYLCNQVFYLARHWAATQPGAPQVGFLHVPALPAQAARRNTPIPSMALETMLAGVQILLEGIQ